MKLRTLRYFLLIPLLFALFFSSNAYAMCPPGFVPIGREYHPDNNTPGLLVYDGIVETLILEPSFKGTATDFGMVLPLPGKPTLKEAPADLFKQLSKVTNEVHLLTKYPGLGFGLAETTPSEVNVIEVKDVGDFTATVLTATSSDSLVMWLEENEYQYSTQDTKNFDYYVNEGGYYFVALKVNMDEANVNGNGQIDGKLSPIGFSFETLSPMLPLRSMSSDMEQMKFTLYVLANAPYYIPGVEVSYSKKVSYKDLEEAPALVNYDAWGLWLVKNEVTFNPRTINTDLNLTVGPTNIVVEDISESVRINPHILTSDSGIVESKRGKIVYTDTTEETSEYKVNTNFSVLNFSRVVVAGMLFLFAAFLLRFFLNALKQPNTSESVEINHIGDLFTGFSAAFLIVLFTHLISESYKYLFSSNARFGMDAFQTILLFLVTALAYLLLVFGPGMYVATKRGWKSFMGVLAYEFIGLLILVLLNVFFPFWIFLPYLV